MQEVTYQEAFNMLKPEPCIFVISSDKQGNPNIMTCGWSTKCSHNPPMYCIAISKSGHTNHLIRELKEFVIAVPHKGMEKHIEAFGSAHGNVKQNKLAESGLETVKAQKIKGLLLKDAAINLECRLSKEVDAGDHFIFIGEVLTAYINPGTKVLVSMKGAHGKRIYEEF